MKSGLGPTKGRRAIDKYIERQTDRICIAAAFHEKELAKENKIVC
jgi:hypothetical protein